MKYSTGYNPPSAKLHVADPALWRPTQYDDQVRDPNLLWLDRGECFDPSFHEFVHRLLADIPVHSVFAYPTPGPLYRKLARHLDVPREHLLLTRGSNGAIKAVFEAYISAGDAIVVTQPTFQMYGVYAQMFGARVHGVPYTLRNGRPHLDVEALIAHISKVRPKLVGLPNPDNPTGFAFDNDQLRDVIEAAGDVGALMLVDEAYFPFLDQTAVPLIETYGHLVVARTFSKAWGMAGIRLGYTVAQPAISETLNKVRTMTESDGISMALAERMLDHQDIVDQSIARLIEGRHLLATELNTLGFNAIETPCNFVLVDFGARRQAATDALANVARFRVFPVPPLENFVRFTTTTPALVRRVIDCLKPAAGN